MDYMLVRIHTPLIRNSVGINQSLYINKPFKATLVVVKAGPAQVPTATKEQ